MVHFQGRKMEGGHNSKTKPLPAFVLPSRPGGHCLLGLTCIGKKRARKKKNLKKRCGLTIVEHRNYRYHKNIMVQTRRPHVDVDGS